MSFAFPGADIVAHASRAYCGVQQHTNVWGLGAFLDKFEVRCSVLPCVAVCCSVLQCVAVCCSVLQCDAV